MAYLIRVRRNLHRKVGGIHFVRLARLQVSFCIVKKREA